MVAVKPREERWEEEAQFFDALARATRPTQIPKVTLDRYGSARPGRLYSKEFRFAVLGDLRGKRILDVGCGDGGNATLLARLGARVTGVDLSPEAIAVGRERARVNGVDHAVDFVCSPIETADLAPDSFDIVWGDGVLHHVLDELPAVMAAVARWTRPGGLMIFSEPVNLCPPLRRLRLKLPLPTEGTPGERPLEAADLDVVRPFFADLTLRYFSLFGRLDRFVLPSGNYERAQPTRRFVSDTLARLDHALLNLRPFQPFAATAVLYGRPQR